jgi:hypothetical protein
VEALTGPLVQMGAVGVLVLVLLYACRSLWLYAQRKEDGHRQERKDDRDAHLGALRELGASTVNAISGLAAEVHELGKDVRELKGQK